MLAVLNKSGMTLCTHSFPAGISLSVRNTHPVDFDFKCMFVFHVEMFPLASDQQHSYLKATEMNSVGLSLMCCLPYPFHTFPLLCSPWQGMTRLPWGWPLGSFGQWHLEEGRKEKSGYFFCLALPQARSYLEEEYRFWPYLLSSTSHQTGWFKFALVSLASGIWKHICNCNSSPRRGSCFLQLLIFGLTHHSLFGFLLFHYLVFSSWY